MSSPKHKIIEQKLFELAVSQSLKLFINELGEPCATIKYGNNKIETLQLKSPRFRLWLVYIYFESEKDAVSNRIATIVSVRLVHKILIDTNNRIEKEGAQ